MKSNIFIYVVSSFLLSAQVVAQTKFEKGYFIDREKNRVECLIKNEDWKNNPSSFEFKTNENSVIKTKDLYTVEEFGIYEKSKFISDTVLIDNSRYQLNSISKNRNPEWEEKFIFLKVLVDGKFRLLRYENSSVIRYLFQVDNNDPQQLVYKQYMVEIPEMGQVIKTNDYYKQQLINLSPCASITEQKIKSLAYNQKDLEKFAYLYNSCFGESTKINRKDDSELLLISFVPGIVISKATMTGNTTEFIFDTDIDYRIGIEIELLLPFNNNKTTIFAEPTYFRYKSVKENSNQFYTLTGSIDYSEIYLTLGVRHYFLSNAKSSFFANAILIVPLPFVFNSELMYSGTPISLNQDFAFGAGVGYRCGKFSLEGRINSPRSISDGISTKLISTTITFKYNFIRF